MICVVLFSFCGLIFILRWIVIFCLVKCIFCISWWMVCFNLSLFKMCGCSCFKSWCVDWWMCMVSDCMLEVVCLVWLLLVKCLVSMDWIWIVVMFWLILLCSLWVMDLWICFFIEMSWCVRFCFLCSFLVKWVFIFCSNKVSWCWWLMVIFNLSLIKVWFDIKISSFWFEEKELLNWCVVVSRM